MYESQEIVRDTSEKYIIKVTTCLSISISNL